MPAQDYLFHNALTPKHKSSVDWRSRVIPKTKKGKIEFAREIIDGAHQVGAVIVPPHRKLWRDYHQHNATLQVLCSSYNARKG